MPPRLPRRKREGAADRRRPWLKCLDRRKPPAAARARLALAGAKPNLPTADIAA